AGQWLRSCDDAMNLLGWQRCQVREKAWVVIGCVVTEIAASTDDPAVVLLREHNGVAPVGRTPGDNYAELTVDVGRATPILASRVAYPDVDLLVDGSFVAELFKPRGTR